ncbi:MAG: PTS sugar transporter subunit IIA [Verrucomicrobia bacterium]|nr:PTS sugar transporter subunit IIA [Verrucomicrobiota bacterium]
MTLKEIAGYLKVSEKTVLRMVQSGEFPGVKVSNQWRFLRVVVDDWLSTKMYAAPKKSLLDVVATAAHVIPLTRLVSNRRIVLGIRPGDKAAVLRQLVDPLQKQGLVDDADAYTERLLAREDVVSTAIGHGLAIPHLRDPTEVMFDAPVIVLGVCREGTHFDALDGKKTFIFAMPCAGSEAAHLRLLAKISLLFRKPGVLKQMTEAKTKKAIIEILAITDHDLMKLGH